MNFKFILTLSLLLIAVASCSSNDDTQPTVAAIIDPDYAGATFINLMQPPPGKQDQLGDILVSAMEDEASLQSGFIDASVHRSRDNNYLINYARWEQASDVDAFVTKLQAGEAPKLADVFSQTSPEFHPYRIVEQFSATPDRPVVFDDSKWTMINILVPNDTTTQSQLADLLREAMREEASAQPGFVSATVHVSLDNNYVVNYAQWEDEASLNAIVARVQAAQLPLLGTTFSRSTPEFHPYGNIETTLAK